jgi:hypothetical protein
VRGCGRGETGVVGEDAGECVAGGERGCEVDRVERAQRRRVELGGASADGLGRFYDRKLCDDALRVRDVAGGDARDCSHDFDFDERACELVLV